MQNGWLREIKKRQVAVLVIAGFFVLLGHCSIEALAFSGATNISNSTMVAHNAATHEKHSRDSHRNHSHHGGANDDCAQMSCCTDVKAEIPAKGIYSTSADHKNVQLISDHQALLIAESDNLPQHEHVSDIGPPGFFPQVHFYQFAFASHAPPQA